MKKIIVEDYAHAVSEVEKHIYSVLDKFPVETMDKFSFLEANFGFHSHCSWTRGYTCVDDSGKVSRYLGRFGVGWSADTTVTTRFSYRTYCYLPFTLSDFIHPTMSRRAVLRFLANAERFGSVAINRDSDDKPSFGSLTPETRAHLRRNVVFGDGAHSYGLLWRGYIQSYVVDVPALEAFCASLSASLGLSD